MIVVVCGSRKWPNQAAACDLVYKLVAALPDGTIVVEGEAEGVDRWARSAAVERGLWVAEMPVRPAHWRRFGRQAGHRRNHAMLSFLTPGTDDHVIAVQHDESSGTQGTIDEARRRGIPVEVRTLEDVCGRCGGLWWEDAEEGGRCINCGTPHPNMADTLAGET